jgi:hypothetical protein
MNIECSICGENFSNVKLKANHIRWKHKNNDLYKEKISNIIYKKYDESLGKLKRFDVNCEFCKKLVIVEEREKTFPNKKKYFCNKVCSSKYASSFVNKTTHSVAMKKSNSIGKLSNRKILNPRVYNFICEICNKPFQRITKKIISTVKTCSIDCYKQLVKINSRLNPNCGGETGYRHYKYKNIWMDSSWEVDIAKWMDENNIKWERDRKKHMFWWTDDTGEERRYYPDFYLPELNLYLDPKNKYKMEKDQIKIERVIEKNKITLIWGLLDNVKNEVDNLRKL